MHGRGSAQPPRSVAAVVPRKTSGRAKRESGRGDRCWVRQSGSGPCGRLVRSQRRFSASECRGDDACAIPRRLPVERTRRGLHLPGRGVRGAPAVASALHLAASVLLRALNSVEGKLQRGAGSQPGFPQGEFVSGGREGTCLYDPQLACKAARRGRDGRCRHMLAVSLP